MKKIFLACALLATLTANAQMTKEEKAAMKKVDLNEESAAAEKKTEEAVEEKASAVNREGDDSRQVASEMASESVLDKYLNRDVLKKK